MENDLTAEQAVKGLAPMSASASNLADEQAELELMRLSLVKSNRATGKEDADEIRLKYAVLLRENEKSAAVKAVREEEQKRHRQSLDPREMVAESMRKKLMKAGIDPSAMSYEQLLAAAKNLEEAREQEQLRANAANQLANYRARLEAAGNRFWSEAGCPRRHVENLAALENSTNAKAKKIRDLLINKASCEAGYLAALLGKRGVGKTLIATAVIRACCLRGFKCKYVKMLDFFRDIRSSFTPVRRGEAGISEADAIEKWIDIDLLVIDEAHQRGETAWEQNSLINLLDRRYDAMASTLLLANHTLAEFSAAMGDSIVSRMHETGQAFVCSWDSYRTPDQWLQGDDSRPRKPRLGN